MLKETKRILKKSKREVIYKIITSLFIQGLALVIPIFWSKTINEISDNSYRLSKYLVLITLLLSIFYYIWSYLNQKAWFKFYNKLYLEYTSLTISESNKISTINLGEYTNILNNDIDIICTFLGNLITRVFQIIEFLVIYAYFLSFNVMIFLITIITSIILIIVYVKKSSVVGSLNMKRKANLDRKTIMLHKLYSSLINKKSDTESITNLFDKDTRVYLRSNYNYNVVIQKIIYFVLGFIETTRYGIILYSIYLVSHGSIEIGTVLLIYSYYGKILTNFEVLGTITADYKSFIVSLERLNKITSVAK